jgi:hypothetical protein
LSNSIIKIGSNDITVKEYKGKRVVTFKDIDQCHGKQDGAARKRFNENKQHFVNEVDFFEISHSDVGDDFGRTYGFNKKAPKGIIITESGYLMLVKSFTDDLAWDVQRQLVNTYFRKGEDETDSSLVKRELAMAKLNNSRARAARILLKVADSVDSTEFKQVLQAHATKEITGQFLIPLPEVPTDYSAGDIAAMFGVTSNAIGIIANANNLKQAAYGHNVYDVTKQGMQVPTWRYFESAIPVFSKLTEEWKETHGRKTRKIVPLNPPKSTTESGVRA